MSFNFTLKFCLYIAFLWEKHSFVPVFNFLRMKYLTQYKVSHAITIHLNPVYTTRNKLFLIHRITATFETFQKIFCFAYFFCVNFNFVSSEQKFNGSCRKNVDMIRICKVLSILCIFVTKILIHLNNRFIFVNTYFFKIATFQS